MDLPQEAISQVLTYIQSCVPQHCRDCKCTPTCEFKKDDRCLLISAGQNLSELVCIMKTRKFPEKFEIRAGNYWVSKKKFITYEEAMNAVDWVAYLLAEKRENICVVPVL